MSPDSEGSDAEKLEEHPDHVERDGPTHSNETRFECVTPWRSVQLHVTLGQKSERDP
jgi:hypothetical protein